MIKNNLAIDVRGLNKSFGSKKVVNNLSLSVPKGKIYGFLGPNGSGKTTSMRMLCGLLTPDSGEGHCLGYDIKNHNNIRNKIGYMTQKFSLWEDLTIKENLEFVSQIYNIKDAKNKIDTTLDNLGLKSRCKQLAGSLSGGWKQRLALAACILHEPELLLLDEPTAGVDPKARREFWDEIHQLAARGLTFLVSTHYMDEAERCHSIIYIAYGNLIVSGTAKEIADKTGLTTFIARGNSLISLQEALRDNPNISSIAPFGETLHISASNSEDIKTAIEPFKKDFTWEVSAPSLEDAFIYYMSGLKG